MVRKGSPVFHRGKPLRVDHPAEGGCPLRAEGALVDRTTRVAFNMQNRIPLGIHQLCTTHSAIGTDTGANPVSLFKARPQGAGVCALRCSTHRILTSQLFWEWTSRVDPCAYAAIRRFWQEPSRLFLHRSSPTTRLAVDGRTTWATPESRLGSLVYSTTT
jgi:hypothetical protein